MTTSRHADCRKNIYIATSCSPEPVRARKDKRGVDLISDALRFGRLAVPEPNAVSNAIGYVQFYSRSHEWWKNASLSDFI